MNHCHFPVRLRPRESAEERLSSWWRLVVSILHPHSLLQTSCHFQHASQFCSLGDTFLQIAIWQASENNADTNANAITPVVSNCKPHILSRTHTIISSSLIHILCCYLVGNKEQLLKCIQTTKSWLFLISSKLVKSYRRDKQLSLRLSYVCGGFPGYGTNSEQSCVSAGVK